VRALDGTFPARGGGTARPTAVVTGASSGIGLYTALGLARAGMRVVMAGRDRARTDAARRFVLARWPAAEVEIALADFAGLGEVRRLAADILAACARIDVLVNNAGLFSSRHRVSADGFELTLAVNHLAPFLLTNLLLDRLQSSAPARIITVASEAHRGQRIDFSTLARPPDGSALRAYGRSKLCNILFTRELADRLSARASHGPAVCAACLHPGLVATRIGERGGIFELGWRLAKPFMLSVEQGARTTLFLATLPDPAPFHGGYVIRNALARPDPSALDRGLARRLWDESARLVGLRSSRA
jgi:NAD(P)-dependent dehydrogenase (short-subunit alcohol dehydrogenase family)